MDKTYIPVSGLPGKMATLVAETIEKRNESGFVLNNIALTGLDQPKKCVIGGKSINLISPEEHEGYLKELGEDVGRSYELIIVDFSQPDAVNRNAELFCKYKIPFVMGTTGGDRGALEREVEKSGNTAVIAPNMAKPIVLLQSMFRYAADNFPKALEGFYMMLRESHQSTKKDTSGTAKAMIRYFEELGVLFDEGLLRKVRDPREQEIFLGVPLEHLEGHGYHNYALQSPDRTVKLQLTHNVNGRQVYADGTIDAIKFLAKKIDEGGSGCVYDMIDVLRNN